jgi:sugar lactone lactonase YvrE/4-amino-4-deoxy-L-arabinose transferase-like glycosyltransferase
MEKTEFLTTEPRKSWLDHSIFSSPMINLEKLIFAIIVIVAIFTRFYMLEPRVMSHDETSHTYFSWLFYKGNGYAHDPVTHGPLQFHLVALSYFLFGDSDTTARIPAAIFSIATVVFMWNYRRYLGRAGALIAALMLTISPYMLYYGRYVRNEAFVAFFAVVMLWSMLRYIETDKPKYLYVFTAVTVLHFCTKETAYIYAAQTLLFLVLYLIFRLIKRRWIKKEYRSPFVYSLISSLTLITLGILIKILSEKSSGTTQPHYPFFASIPTFIPTILIILGLIAAIGALVFAISGFGLSRIREERSFDLLMLLGTLVLPLLSAFGINFFDKLFGKLFLNQLSAYGINPLNWKIPINASDVNALTGSDVLRMAIIVIPVFILSIILGLWWNKRQWLINAGIWYVTFIVLYTSMFTNGVGFFTGLVGSLGYWIAQQAVNRGDQPWYYYGMQISIYEFLPLIGTFLGIILALMGRTTVHDDAFDIDDKIVGESDPSTPPSTIDSSENDSLQLESQDGLDGSTSTLVKPPTVGLLIFWSITSLLAYSIAGEKMPWLTVHITLPMILLSGWSFGYLIDTTDWAIFRTKKGWLMAGLLLIFVPALLSSLRALLGDSPPFTGKSLDQLAATSEFTIAFLLMIACAIGLLFLMKDWSPQLIRRGLALVFIFLVAILTARAAFMASYINYDLAKEYLVYAHSAPGDKIALQQITDISRRLTGGLDIAVAYDDLTTYPYWWYLRNFPNQRYFGSTPTRDLRDVPIILVGEKNFGKIEAIVGQTYDKFDYRRIWWPNMDYMNLNKERILNAIKNPQMREAIFQIWLNRDYTLYGQLVGQDMSLQNWNPAEKFRLYIRKDVLSQLWDYGSTPSTLPVQADPYDGKEIALPSDSMIGIVGTQPGQFQNPRDVALAPDGTFYITDTSNNRIQHIGADGSVLSVWGSFADIAKGAAPGGTFYEPWGIAVGKDGFVYVADTWNHRIQKFTSNGEFVNMWGYFGQADTPFAIWGPRDIAIDEAGNLYVTDTGNKRIVIYDADGNYINQFGSVGLEAGQFNEPVGIAVDKDGLVYIADTWNQRIQVMTPDGSGNYSPLIRWEVVAWYGQSLDNKPYLSVDNMGNLYTTDPEGNRILHFTTTGTFINYFGDYGTDPNSFNLPTGITTDNTGGIWVADAGNGRIMHFSPSTQ